MARPQPTLAVSTVDSFVCALRRAGADVHLLHTPGASSSASWHGDVDLLVVGATADSFLQTLRAQAADHGFTQVVASPRVFNTLEIDVLCPDARSWTVIYVDKDGVRLQIDAALAPALPSTVCAASDASPLEPPLMVVYTILKRLRKSDLSPETWAAIAAVTGGVAPDLSEWFGPELGRALSSAAVAGRPPARELARRARWHMRLRARRQNSHLVGAVRTALRRASRPTGLFVAFAGVDGSGKSTVADALEAWSPFTRFRRIHSRPGLLKPPGWYVGREPKTATSPHAEAPWGKPMSTARLAYFWLDFVAGYWLRIWPVRARGGFVISERWWWDLYVDPARHRLQPMPLLARVLGRFVPAPDAYFVLDARADVITDRKQELPPAEIERQRRVWRAITPRMPAARMIDASRPASAVAESVVEEAVGAQSRRSAEDRSGRADSAFVVLPRSEPRWLMDPRDPRSIRAAFDLYQPSRSIKRLIADGLRATSSASLTATGLRMFSRRPSTQQISDLEWIRATVAERMTDRPVSVAAYLGSAGPAKRLTAAVLDETGRVCAFGKAASGAQAVAGLRREAWGLELAASVAPSAVVPSVLHSEYADGRGLLLLSPVDGVRKDNRSAPTSEHLRVIAEMLAHARPCDGTERWQHLTRLADSITFDETVGDRLRSVVASTSRLWSSVSSEHFAHGDFTPWNCLDCHTALGVVDWEMSGFRLPGWDAVHYVFQVESLTSTDPPMKAAHRALRSPFLASAEAVVLKHARVELPQDQRWTALQLLSLIESAVTLAAEQPEISGRGIAVRSAAIDQLLLRRLDYGTASRKAS